MLRFLAISCEDGADALAEMAELCRGVPLDRGTSTHHVGGPNCRLYVQDPVARLEDTTRVDDRSRRTARFLIGRAFKTGSNGETRLLSGPVADDVGGSGALTWAAELAAAWWGDYVTIAVDGDRLLVTRDPKGALPCYYIEHGKCTIWFSDIAWVPPEVLTSVKANTRIFTLNLLLPRMSKRRTGLVGVEEVLPGTTCTANGDVKRETLNWLPATFAAGPMYDMEPAISAIRASVIDIVSAYVTYFDRPIISVGGLDSSILWCVAHHFTDRQVEGVSLYSDAARGDERRYVRELPGQANLVSTRMLAERIDVDRLFEPRRMVSPLGFIDLIDMSWDRTALSSGADAQAMLYGVGGDNVFLQGAGFLPALDFWQSFGIGGETFRHVMDSARATPTSVANVLRECMTQRLKGRDNWGCYVEQVMREVDRSALADDLFDDPPRPDEFHPAFTDINTMKRGKSSHALTTCFNLSEYYDGHNVEPIERCELLFSQPIVEACLRTPTWLLAYNGIDRGLARLAFADILPDSIARRTSKGSPEDVYDDFARLHGDRIANFLRDGALMELGIITQSSLTSAIEGDPAKDQRKSHRLLSLVSYEAWLRQWS